MTNSRPQKAELLNSLHISGTLLIVTNVWDAVTAKNVSAVPELLEPIA
jgi:hypothetical protein